MTFYIEKINPFHATGLFLYPLKKSENQRFSVVFRGYRKRPAARKGLMLTMFLICRQNHHRK